MGVRNSCGTLRLADREECAVGVLRGAEVTDQNYCQLATTNIAGDFQSLVSLVYRKRRHLRHKKKAPHARHRLAVSLFLVFAADV